MKNYRSAILLSSEDGRELEAVQNLRGEIEWHFGDAVPLVMTALSMSSLVAWLSALTIEGEAQP